ncbi:MAG TPA: hypothetical protein VMS18_12240 [Candidatus Binatia bacterium]|nr:hypothetical protein [Candidatus Binatia bacterium]
MAKKKTPVCVYCKKEPAVAEHAIKPLCRKCAHWSLDQRFVNAFATAYETGIPIYDVLDRYRAVADIIELAFLFAPKKAEKVGA